MKEYELQKSIIKFIKLKYPNILYCASAGGMRTSISVAKRMKATGYVKGTPDIAIYEPRGQFHSLFLEVKTLKGRPTKDQIWWRNELNKRNFISEIVYGYDEATLLIDKYLNNLLNDLN